MKFLSMLLTVLLNLTIVFSSAGAAQQKMSPVNSRAAKKTATEKAKAADSTLLLRLAPGISAADVKKLLHERGLKAKKVFKNLSEEKSTAPNVQHLKKDARPIGRIL